MVCSARGSIAGAWKRQTADEIVLDFIAQWQAGARADAAGEEGRAGEGGAPAYHPYDEDERAAGAARAREWLQTRLPDDSLLLSLPMGGARDVDRLVDQQVREEHRQLREEQELQPRGDGHGAGGK